MTAAPGTSNRPRLPPRSRRHEPDGGRRRLAIAMTDALYVIMRQPSKFACLVRSGILVTPGTIIATTLDRGIQPNMSALTGRGTRPYKSRPARRPGLGTMESQSIQRYVVPNRRPVAGPRLRANTTKSSDEPRSRSCVWCAGTGFVQETAVLCRTCHGTGIAR